MFSEIALVFDVNVWIDAAICLKKMGRIPPISESSGSSSQSASLCFSWFAQDSSIRFHLFTDDLIQQVAYRKLVQPVTASRREDQGLGWSPPEAVKQLSALLRLVDATGRSFRVAPPAKPGSIGDDFEDERVFGVLEHATFRFPEMVAIMVTNDRSFASEITVKSPILASGLPRWAAMSPMRFIQQIAMRART